MFVIVFSSNLTSLSIIIMQALILLIVYCSIFMFRFKYWKVSPGGPKRLLPLWLCSKVFAVNRQIKSWSKWKIKSGRKDRISPYLFKNIKVRIPFKPPPPQRNQRRPHWHRYLAAWRRCVGCINSVIIECEENQEKVSSMNTCWIWDG